MLPFWWVSWWLSCPSCLHVVALCMLTAYVGLLSEIIFRCLVCCWQTQCIHLLTICCAIAKITVDIFWLLGVICALFTPMVFCDIMMWQYWPLMLIACIIYIRPMDISTVKLEIFTCPSFGEFTGCEYSIFNK